ARRAGPAREGPGAAARGRRGGSPAGPGRRRWPRRARRRPHPPPPPPAAPEPAAARAQRRPDLVQLVAELLLAELLRPADHEVGQEPGRVLQPLQVLLVPVAQGELELDLLAPGLLGQERDLDPGRQLLPLHAGLDR